MFKKYNRFTFVSLDNKGKVKNMPSDWKPNTIHEQELELIAKERYMKKKQARQKRKKAIKEVVG
tara:strand:- start:1188 stop:1379 length:192 start_codon:yes stop_codon:yes gene_type:complete